MHAAAACWCVSHNMAASPQSIPLNSTPEQAIGLLDGDPYFADLVQRVRGGAALSERDRALLHLGAAGAHAMAGDAAARDVAISNALAESERLADPDLRAMALAQQAYWASLSDPDAAQRLAKASLAITDQLPLSNMALRALGYHHFNYTCEWDLAERYFEQSVRLCRRTNYLRPLVYSMAALNDLVTSRGRFAVSADLIRALRDLQPVAPAGHWAVCFSEMRTALGLNDPTRARAALAELKSLITGKFIEAHYHLAHAELSLADDAIPEARQSAQRALDLARGMSYDYFEILPVITLARACQRGRAFGDAIQWLDTVESLGMRRGIFDHLHHVWLLRAQCLRGLGQHDAARDALRRARERADALDAAHVAADACLIEAIWLFEDGALEATAAFLDAERRISRGGYAFLYEAERAACFRMLAAHARGADPAAHAAADRALEHLRRVAPLPLQVHGLGRFEVRQGQRVIPAAEWKRRKAGELFRFLLLQPRREAHREQIMDALWQEVDRDAAQQNLHHASSTLRRVLEPDLPEKFPSRYLLFEHDVLSLRLPEGSTVDFDDLEAALKHNPAQAAALPGDLFPEDRAADWSTAARERLREGRLVALLALGAEHLSGGRPAEALIMARTILAEDAWREDAVLLGMRAALAMNDRPAALRLYTALERTLQNELAISPRDDLRVLAGQIRSA